MGRAWIRTVLGFPHAHLVGVADVLDGAAARAVEEEVPEARREAVATGIDAVTVAQQAGAEAIIDVTIPADRKSTRLNSSHVAISYAVFCLKKKKKHASTAHKTHN